MRYLLFIIFTTYSITLLHSQNNNRIWGGLEVGYGLSLSDRGSLYSKSYNSESRMEITTLRGVIGYYLTSQISVGTGIGFNTYTKPQLNTVPLTLDIRIRPISDNLSFILNGNIGYIVATSENDSKGRFIADFSVGYKVSKLRNISIIPSIGYNFIDYAIEYDKSDGTSVKYTQSRHSLFLKIGLIY